MLSWGAIPAGQGAAASQPRPLFAPHGSRAGTQPQRILVVEDDYLAAMEIEAGLIDSGFDVVEIANSAEEALELARLGRPALIVMDIRLVGQRDGIAAALDIFTETGIRCIFATANHTQQMRARAQPAAPLGWLAKPYTREALVSAVRRGLQELQAKT